MALLDTSITSHHSHPSSSMSMPGTTLGTQWAVSMLAGSMNVPTLGTQWVLSQCWLDQ